MAVISATALAYASLAATAVSTGVAVYGQVQQAKAADATSKHNAKIAAAEAANKHARGLENIRRKREQNRRFLSRQSALMAGRGIAMEGTALQIMGESASRLELAVQDAFVDLQYDVNRSLSERDSQLYQGEQAKTAGLINAGSTLLSGATKFGESYSTFKASIPAKVVN